MSKWSVHSLIPEPEDAESSDDEFLDALEEIENTCSDGDVEADGAIEPLRSLSYDTETEMGEEKTVRGEVSLSSTPRDSITSKESREMPEDFNLTPCPSTASSSMVTPMQTPLTEASFVTCPGSGEAAAVVPAPTAPTPPPRPSAPSRNSSQDTPVRHVSRENQTAPVKSPAVPPRPAVNPSNESLTEDEILKMTVFKCLDTGEEYTLEKAYEVADPVTQLLGPRLGINLGDSDSDNSSFTSSRATISTIGTVDLEDDEKRKSSPHHHHLKKGVSRMARRSVKGVKSGMKSGVKSMREGVRKMKMPKKELESSPEWQVQEGSFDMIRVFQNRSYNREVTPVTDGKFSVTELQTIENSHHNKSIWAMKFAPGGRLLATAGDDGYVKVWVLMSSREHFLQKYLKLDEWPKEGEGEEEEGFQYFAKQPLRVYKGGSPIIDVAWSPSQYFLLSTGANKLITLWHIARANLIFSIPHSQMAAVTFHPFDCSLFMSGTLDGKLQLWSTRNKKMLTNREIRNGDDGMITAVYFQPYNKNMIRAFVGTFMGNVTILFLTAKNTFEYYTSFNIQTRGLRGQGCKITNFAERPGTKNILITSCDSRIRLIDPETGQMICKYKGYFHQQSIIRSGFSHDGKLIIAGDEKSFCYFWDTETHNSLPSLSNVSAKHLKRQLRRDKNDCYYRFRSHKVRVTCASFAPEALTDREGFIKELFVTADQSGRIKFFLNIRNDMVS